MVDRALRWLEHRPVAGLLALRAVMLVSPPLNYALATTRMRHRDFVVGSTIGLLLPLWLVTGGLSHVVGQ